MTPFGPETEPLFWLPFKREEVALLLAVPGLERLYEIGVNKVKNNDLLNEVALRDRAERITHSYVKLSELELEL